VPYTRTNAAMNIGYLALGIAALLGVVALVCYCLPAQPQPVRQVDYQKIYAAMTPREL